MIARASNLSRLISFIHRSIHQRSRRTIRAACLATIQPERSDRPQKSERTIRPPMELSRVYREPTLRSDWRTHSPVVRSNRIRHPILCRREQNYCRPNQGRNSQTREDHGHRSRAGKREQMHQETREVINVDVSREINNLGCAEQQVVAPSEIRWQNNVQGTRHTPVTNSDQKMCSGLFLCPTHQCIS